MARRRTIRRRNQGGRTRTFTPRVRRLLYAAINAGLPYRRACEMVGVKLSSFDYWMQRGKRDPESSPYTQFVNYIKRIEARKEKELLAVIDKVAVGNYKVRETKITFNHDKGRSFERRTREILPNWKAAAWQLERKYPETYFLRDNNDDTRDPEQIAQDIREAYDALDNSVPLCEDIL